MPRAADPRDCARGRADGTMEENKAPGILMRPAHGAHSRAGAPLPAESPYQDPETIRALFTTVPAPKYRQKYK